MDSRIESKASTIAEVAIMFVLQDIQVSVYMRGWVTKIECFKKHAFLHVRDGHDTVQVVVASKMTPFALPVKLTTEAYIAFKGTAKKVKQGAYSYQTYEVHCDIDELDILSQSELDYSARCPADAGPEVKLELRHLYLRDPKFSVITKARALFLKAARDYFFKTSCTELIPPCFVGNQCEGGATLFKLKHPEEKAMIWIVI